MASQACKRVLAKMTASIDSGACADAREAQRRAIMACHSPGDQTYARSKMPKFFQSSCGRRGAFGKPGRRRSRRRKSRR